MNSTDGRPLVGDRFEAYFGGMMQTATVVEWRGRRCFFDNGWFLVWIDGRGFGF
jgi:hypothetical protein